MAIALSQFNALSYRISVESTVCADRLCARNTSSLEIVVDHYSARSRAVDFPVRRIGNERWKHGAINALRRTHSDLRSTTALVNIQPARPGRVTPQHNRFCLRRTFTRLSFLILHAWLFPDFLCIIGIPPINEALFLEIKAYN